MEDLHDEGTGTVWIETTKPMNLPEPPEGMPKNYTAPGHRCEVPEYVAKRLIQAGEAMEVDGPHGEELEADDESGDNTTPKKRRRRRSR